MRFRWSIVTGKLLYSGFGDLGSPSDASCRSLREIKWLNRQGGAIVVSTEGATDELEVSHLRGHERTYIHLHLLCHREQKAPSARCTKEKRYPREASRIEKAASEHKTYPVVSVVATDDRRTESSDRRVPFWDGGVFDGCPWTLFRDCIVPMAVQFWPVSHTRTGFDLESADGKIDHAQWQWHTEDSSLFSLLRVALAAP